MPTVADLERLNALMIRLNPLGDAAQGEIIRAEDWNTLVHALVEVARVVLAEDRQAVPAPHEHPDQVTAGWLDPRLRALIERGPLSDPGVEARMQALEQRVDRLTARIESLLGSVGEVRDRVTEVTTRDLLRQSEITNVRRVVEGLDDSRESVRELRETLGVLQKDVLTAVTVGQRLTVDGQPIDFKNFDERLNQADELRTRLTAPNGEVFDARGFENRLTELSNTLVTQQALDEALETVRRTIPLNDLAQLEGNLRNQLLGQMNASFGTFRDEVRAENNTRFAEVDSQINTRIADAVPDITAQVLGSVRPEINAAVSATRESLTVLIDQRVSDLSSSLKADYTQQFDDLRLSIGTQVGVEVDRRLSTRLEGVSSRVGRLEESLRPLTERVGKLETDVTDVRTRIDRNATDSNTRTGILRNELLAEMDRRDQVQAGQFDRQLTALDGALSQRINVAIADSRRTLREETLVVARDTARAEVGVVETRLRGDIGSISRDAVTEIVRTEISAEVPNLTRTVADTLRSRPPSG
jgi:predicted  nucleic acid-binding Zn-ribbon protein